MKPGLMMLRGVKGMDLCTERAQGILHTTTVTDDMEADVYGDVGGMGWDVVALPASLSPPPSNHPFAGRGKRSREPHGQGSVYFSLRLIYGVRLEGS